MNDPVDRAIRAIARRNSYALVWAQFGTAHLVTLAGLGLGRLYQPMSVAHFLTIIGVSQGLVAIDNIASIKLTRSLWRPVLAWERTPAADRTPELTAAAWWAVVTLPREYVRRVRLYPFTLAYLPFTAFTVWLLGLPWYSFFIIAAAGTAVIAYGLIALVTTDETGRLAQSFNTMIEGLEERERPRRAFGAYVDPEFIGDGLLGVFGAPEPRPDHGERAVTAALEIAATVSAAIAGRVSIGIGDTVNTASRVEAATRLTGDPVLITQATRALLPPTWSVAMAERSDVALRGKQAPVRLWAPAVQDAARTQTRAESVAD